MNTLFIDTHSEIVTIAIKKGNRIYTKSESSNKSHSEIVIPLLNKLLKDSGLEKNKIEEIIVVNGPGSFTGVRIGVTIAKTLAYCLKIPIKTITSLELYGESCDEEFDIVTINDSKGVYSARKENSKYINFMYQKNDEFKKYIDVNNYKVLNKKNIDIDKICGYLKDVKAINPHVANPIYIKEIDALK